MDVALRHTPSFGVASRNREETVGHLHAFFHAFPDYGVRVERSTFVIDGDGKLRKAWRGVKVPGHIDEVLAFVQKL